VLVGALMLYRRIGGFRGKESLKLGVWRIAMPLLIVSISNFAVIQADVWILGAYLADEQVAIYAAAARLVALISMPLQIASAVISPTIAALSNQKRHDELERLVRGVATVTGLPSAAVVVSFMFAGESILGLVYGDYYRAGASVLVLLSLARLVYAWTGPCGILLIMSGHQGSAMWITVVSSMVSVAGAFFFVRFGVIGVAASFAAGMAIENICMTVYGVLAIGIKSYMSLRSLGLGR
jgi:O-antigen/teichoic acid export membrane protein